MLSAKTKTRDTEGKTEAQKVLEEQPKVRLNLDIDRPTMRQLKTRAVADDTTVSKIVRGLVNEYLSK